jgi:uracil-DNA glycosylase
MFTGLNNFSTRFLQKSYVRQTNPSGRLPDCCPTVTMLSELRQRLTGDNIATCSAQCEDKVMIEDRAAALAAIAQEIRTCKLCRLREKATNPVPGAGDARAEMMFIGEGPGYYEDKQGLPFVGRSGDYLEKLLKLINLNRDQVFIGNVVKHRPPDNRDPLPDEIIACKPYLDRQIEALDPLLIVTLGRFSMARYFPNAKISQIHGKPKFDDRRAYYPLFHPAAILRNPSMEPQMEADFKRLPEVLEQVRARRASNPARPPTPTEKEPEEPPKQLRLF